MFQNKFPQKIESGRPEIELPKMEKPEKIENGTGGLTEWKPNEDSIKKALEYFVERKVTKTSTTEKTIEIKQPIAIRMDMILPRKGGEWTDKPGNSDWVPNRDEIPKDRHGTNSEHKTWDEILNEYGIESIPFVDGYPDFSEVSRGRVKIDDFTEDRNANFAQADEKLAEQRGCTPQEVKAWREAHGYTWHECEDCKTMQKVPTEVHGNVSHSGGISVYKSQHADT